MVTSVIIGALASTAAVGGASAVAKVSTHAGLVALSASTSTVGGSAVSKASATLAATAPWWGYGHGAYGYMPWGWGGYWGGAYGAPYFGRYGFTSCLPWTWNWPYGGAYGGLPYASLPYY